MYVEGEAERIFICLAVYVYLSGHLSAKLTFVSSGAEFKSQPKD